MGNLGGSQDQEIVLEPYSFGLEIKLPRSIKGSHSGCAACSIGCPMVFGYTCGRDLRQFMPLCRKIENLTR